MQNNRFLPKIETVFHPSQSNPNNVLYHDVIHNALKRLLPDHLSFIRKEESDSGPNVKNSFHSLLPLVTWTRCVSMPGDISFFALSKYRSNSFKFFFDMVSCWLVPGKRLNVMLIYAVDFRMPEFSDDVYTLCEVMIRLENAEEWNQVMQNLPIIAAELRLGIESSFYARRILEIKGLAADVKTALIQEHVAFLISRLPHVFDYDVLTEMQHVLVICREDFKNMRECKHLSRIISIHYIFRKDLREVVKTLPKKRHINLKLFKARLGTKTVLGIIVGVNFLRDKEVFENKHLLKAIQNYIPNARTVENSFFANRRGFENVCTLYLEIEKSDGKSFTSKEVNILRKELPTALKECIEYPIHPVFMPRNEEEVIRNILSLSSQIKYVRDIPQVFITFDEQTHTYLLFTVILVRVLKPGFPSIQEMFKEKKSFLEYIHDRSQSAGSLRRKYPKEATVFRVKFSKEEFLRADHSIDLNKARQQVVAELSRIIGEVRDFNGGMISKQNELLCQVRDLLGQQIKYNELTLENFFYSLMPVVMRTVLEPDALKTLFMMMLKSQEHTFANNENFSLKVLIQPHFAYVMVKTSDPYAWEEIARALAKLQIHPYEMVRSYVSIYDVHYLGYIYRCDEFLKQHQFCKTIRNAMETEVASQ